MLAILGTLVLGFVLFEAAVFGSHYMMHVRWTGPLWRAHQEHHKRYNPKQPTTEKFQPIGWRSFRFRALIFLAAVGLVFAVFPISIALILLVEFSVLSYLTDYIHDATHTTGHKLEKYGWYRRLMDIHQIHHANAKKNLGILTFFWDRLAGRFKRSA